MWNKYAKLIVDYCVDIKKLDEVIITSSIEAYPLVIEIYKEAIKRGAYPRFLLNDDAMSEIFYKYASTELLEYLSPIDRFIMENIDVRISILSPTHTKPLMNIDPERRKIREKALKELKQIFMNREASGKLRWVVAAYPTKAMAQEAGMGIIEFEEFVIKAVKLSEEDPVKAWIEQANRQNKVIKLLSRVDELRFVSEDTDLVVKVGGRTWINDDGKNNMPGGEVFTAPHEDSAEGYITFTYPAIYGGVEVEGIRLRFRNGNVIDAYAMKGDEFLKKILEVDEGVKKIGELAFGLNYNINRFTKQILFDEKIGGTIHIALGFAYLRTGGRNVSAVHWDMIKDMRDGLVYADGDLVYKNGKFVIDDIV
ncbi:MAG: aminopeptidase [Ignisphaera sp.]